MTYSAGDRIGPYEIVASLGAGGMGEVYRARDKSLGREVAIKVLPEDLASDPGRQARFKREAKLLASINHPNIATLYGFERDREVSFLAMELVKGENLAQRIRRGPISVEQALALFVQIAAGLEAAHERGVIHRDLKPANIEISEAVAGQPSHAKILDFGLAKALAKDVPEEGSGSDSPTLTYMATQQGTILGTPPYMSPEQARGQTVDRRTDIWAFGCCLYETLTGRRTFDGKDVSMIQACILTSQPNWGALPMGTPRALRRILRRCLAKDPGRRYQHVGDLRLEIQEMIDAPEGVDESERMSAPVALRHPRMVAGLIVLVLASAAAGWIAAHFDRAVPAAPSSLRHFSIDLPSPTIARESKPRLSDDGETLVFIGLRDGAFQLFARRMDGPEARPIPGTEGVVEVALAPDGQRVAFVSGRELKKTHITGGTVETICILRGAWPVGLSWGADDMVRYGTISGGLYQVSTSGGEVRSLTSLDEERGDRFHWKPQLLPGGRSVLFTVGLPGATRLAIVSIGSGRVEVLVDGIGGRYTPTGHLVFVRGSSLWALPFDVQRLQATGPEALVLQEALAARDFTIAADGSLVYVPTGAVPESSLEWVDRTGNATLVTADRRDYRNPRLSPDGSQIAMGVGMGSERDQDIWVLDAERGTSVRFTVEGTLNRWPTWTMGGTRIVFTSNRDGELFDLYWKAVDGSGPAEPLLGKKEILIPMSWSEGHSTLAFYEVHSATYRDLWVLPVGSEPEPFLTSPFDERSPVFSPNGQWLAYVSDESGRAEVYVREYPGPGRPWPISSGGGREPVWSRDGSELYFRRGYQMMAVAVKTEPSFAAGPANLLFEAPYDLNHFGNPNYDVAEDGRFLMVRSDEESRQASLQIVLGWFEELQRLAPIAR